MLTTVRARWATGLLVPLVLLLPACSDEQPGSFEATRPPLATPNRADVADDVRSVGVPQLVNVTLADGQATGDTGTVPVVLNSPVRVTVVADVVDTVVVEGYSITSITQIGSPVQIEFPADRPGTFPVRLEGSGRVLTTLQVG